MYNICLLCMYILCIMKKYKYNITITFGIMTYKVLTLKQSSES